VRDNARMNIKEVKHCEAEDASVVIAGEEDGEVNDGDDEGDDDGDEDGDDEGEGAFPLSMVILSFIP